VIPARKPGQRGQVRKFCTDDCRKKTWALRAFNARAHHRVQMERAWNAERLSER